jgi:two-component system, chemotaxis family, CheB/CheR fusion protein
MSWLTDAQEGAIRLPLPLSNRRGTLKPRVPMATSPEMDNFERLLEHLRHARGVDFAAYKRTSLMRRVTKRMDAVGVTSYDGYLDFLQLHPDEFEPLFNTILINVTSFFRDPEVWAYLDTAVLAGLLDNRAASEPLRVWCAGCASGEEAYSVAMLLAERIGIDGVREHAKIYATDIDQETLSEARRAAFPIGETADLPPGFLEKYFTVDGNVAALNRELRRAVMFGRIDLLEDAPISRIDLLLCRNTLMYFNSEAQARVLSRFSFSLKPEGSLVLGRAEMLFSHSGMFVPVDLPHRIFRVSGKSAYRERRAPSVATGCDDQSTAAQSLMRLRQAAFDADPAPQLMIDSAGALVSASAAARRQFSIRPNDLGKPLRELEVSYRPANLRSAIDQATTDRREVILKDVHHVASGQRRSYEVTIAPIVDEQHAILGMRISFADCTAVDRLRSELQAAKQELETAYEELRSTNEELETTNEKLQSTVEELETTNEELHSTNEELETLNQELQSTNQELQTINDELRTRTADADVVNVYLESVFSSLRAGVVVVDSEYRVRVWNRGAEELWGIRRDEAAGASFVSLDIGLPVAELAEAIRQVFTGECDSLVRTVRSTTRRGKAIDCRVSLTPLAATDTSGKGVVLIMEDAEEAVSGA